jgi:hypothetical protein
VLFAHGVLTPRHEKEENCDQYQQQDDHKHDANNRSRTDAPGRACPGSALDRDSSGGKEPTERMFREGVGSRMD